MERPVLASDRNRIEGRVTSFRESVRPMGGSFQPAESLSILEHLGDEISSYLLPQGIAKLLSDPDLQGSVLILESNELSFPWELTRIDGKWLWERFVVARREIRPSYSALRVATPIGQPSKIRRMLVVADPEGSLPAALQEAETLVKTFQDNPQWQVEVLQGAQATTDALIDRLQSKPFTILHFATTADYNPVNPLYSRIFLADEPLPAGRLREVRFQARPRMVILNSCQSGREDPESPLLARSSGWARLFLDLGAELVLGPLWDVSDNLSAWLTATTYQRFLGGETFGEALQAVRLQLLRRSAPDPFATAHAYVLYGDPTLSMQQLLGHGGPFETTTKIRVPTGDTVAVPQDTPEKTFQHLPPGAGDERTAAWILQARHHLNVVAGREAGRRVPLLPQTMLEGRHILIGSKGRRINEIELDDPFMDNAEACLEFRQGGFHLINQSKSPSTRVNGEPVGERVALKGGERIQIAQTTMLYEVTAEEGVPSDRFFLEVLQGVPADAGRRFNMVAPLTRIGRLPDNSVQLQDPAVSRHHVSILMKDGLYTLVHEGSNPTLVNGVPVANERRLQHGDEIQLSGRTVVRFVDRSMEVFD